MNDKIFQFRKQLKNKLPPSRYEHSLSVSFLCTALAMCHGYDMEKAELAGLLHDCAKQYEDTVLIEKCMKHGISLTPEEQMAPVVIHAIYGAWMAKEKFGIQDEEVLSAIRYHTTGKPGMGMLEKILYIADYIEPRRDKAANLSHLRQLAFQDLDQTLFEMLGASLEYLHQKGCSVDPMTQQAFEYYQRKGE